MSATVLTFPGPFDPTDTLGPFGPTIRKCWPTADNPEDPEDDGLEWEDEDEPLDLDEYPFTFPPLLKAA